MKKLLKLLFKPKRMLLIDLDDLKNDESFRMAWRSNIAMCFKDEHSLMQNRSAERGGGTACLNQAVLHILSNAAADRFIEQLTYNPSK